MDHFSLRLSSATNPEQTVRIPVREGGKAFDRTLDEVMEDLRECIMTATNVAYTLHLKPDSPSGGSAEARPLLAVTITRFSEGDDVPTESEVRRHQAGDAR